MAELKVIMQARTPKIGELVEACAVGELSFQELCELREAIDCLKVGDPEREHPNVGRVLRRAARVLSNQGGTDV